MGLLALMAGGCVSGRPWTVRIEAGPSAPPGEGQSTHATHLSVTTFNVWGLPPWINGASQSRHARIAGRLQELGSDIVLLQEAWTSQSYEVLSQRSEGEARVWWSAAARRRRGLLGQNGLLTLSRYPIESAEFRPFTAARLPDSLMRKGALKVTLAIRPGQRVNVWNVHLQQGRSARVRSHQIAELARWIDEAREGEVADIVGGDFNFTPESTEFDRLAGAVGKSVYELAGVAPLPTWDGLKPDARAPQTLDYIFVGLGHTGQEVDAQPRLVLCDSRRGERLSDHLGVESRLTIRNRLQYESPPLAWRSPAAALPSATVSARP
jgi:endonuclease/exonuclease/phosphatase family metal-dependent hydrolase